MASKRNGPPITTDQPPTPAQHGSHAPHGYEETDIEAGPVVISGIMILGFAAVGTLAMALFLGVMTSSWVTGVVRPKESAAEVLPKEGDQAYHVEDWRKWHREQLGHISKVAWVNKEQGVAKIPIDRAMELVLDKLPARPAPEPSPGSPR
jgi:hypothetical protein